MQITKDQVKRMKLTYGIHRMKPLNEIPIKYLKWLRKDKIEKGTDPNSYLMQCMDFVISGRHINTNTDEAIIIEDDQSFELKHVSSITHSVKIPDMPRPPTKHIFQPKVDDAYESREPYCYKNDVSYDEIHDFDK